MAKSATQVHPCGSTFPTPCPGHIDTMIQAYIQYCCCALGCGVTDHRVLGGPWPDWVAVDTFVSNTRALPSARPAVGALDSLLGCVQPIRHSFAYMFSAVAAWVGAGARRAVETTR
jgi:hypothetical protein